MDEDDPVDEEPLWLSVPFSKKNISVESSINQSVWKSDGINNQDKPIFKNKHTLSGKIHYHRQFCVTNFCPDIKVFW